jgi:beta-glucosidase
LRPGERRQIRFRLSPRDLSFVTRDGMRQLTPGQYTLSVGSGQPGARAAGQDASFVLSRTAAIAQ